MSELNKMSEIIILNNNPDDKDIITPKKEYEYELKFNEKKKYPENCFIFFQSEIMEKFVENIEMKLVETFLGNYFFYEAKDKSFGVILFGIGASLSSLLIERLIVRGIKKFITIGTSGSLKINSRTGDIYLCDKSIRDEGVSYHYIKPSKYSESSILLNNRIKEKFKKDDLVFYEGSSWTTDAGYKESITKARQYRKEGVICVDMESASLFAIAKHRGVDISSIFILSDFIDKDFNWNPQFHKKEIINSVKKLRNSLISIF